MKKSMLFIEGFIIFLVACEDKSGDTPNNEANNQGQISDYQKQVEAL